MGLEHQDLKGKTSARTSLNTCISGYDSLFAFLQLKYGMRLRPSMHRGIQPSSDVEQPSRSSARHGHWHDKVIRGLAGKPRLQILLCDGSYRGR